MQRPLDTKSDLRILLEAEAILGLLALSQSGVFELISSDALIFEIERTPDLTRREYALAILSRAKHYIQLVPAIEERARELVALGFKPLDALHLASAVAGKADYLCTCDDRFLKRADALKVISTEVITPIELIREVGPWKSK